MLNRLLTIILFLLVCLNAQSQTLGTYPVTSAIVGRNLEVIPSSAPTNTSDMLVTSSPGFLGVLAGYPNTGKVTIINARPAGTYLIKVKAFSTLGGNATKTFILTVNEPDCTQGDLVAASIVSTGPNQNTAVIGDFNRDGHQDIAAAHEGGNNTLSIRLGDGTGGFYGSTELPVGSHPYNVAVADINRDGIHDLVTTNSGDNSITPILGVGNGTFIVKQVCDVGDSPLSLVIADFDNDGKPDLATANLNENTISFRRGNGGGFFYGTTEINVGLNPFHIALGDFNNDGKHDLATSNSGDNTVSIRLGNGAGNFSNAPDVPVGTNPICIAVGDFNHDGNDDIATANYIDNTVSIRLGDGNGNFYGNTEVPAGVGAYFVALGNFNGDDHLDMCVSNYFGNTVSMRFGNGAGGFVVGNDVPVGSYPTCVTVAELNQDNFTDLIISNYSFGSVSVHLGLPGGPPATVVLSNSPVCEETELILQAFGGTSYSWIGPNGFTSNMSFVVRSNMTMADSGIYQVTIIDSAKCVDSVTKNVIVWPSPQVAFFLVNDTVCSTSPPMTLIGGYPPGGLYVGTGMFGNVFDPAFAGPGTHTITYNYWDERDCSKSDSEKIFVLICTDAEELNAGINFSIYPNPTSGELHFQTLHRNATASLYSIQGVLIKEWNLKAHATPLLSISEFADGFYTLFINDSERILVTKIIKQ